MSYGNSDHPLIAEISEDEQGIEHCWRAHFGFYRKVEESADSDGDGMNDAEEARQWTNPLGSDSIAKDQTADQRRQAAMGKYLSAAITINGKDATPAEVLAAEEIEGRNLARSLKVASEFAKVRAESWSQRTGQPLSQGGKEQLGKVVIDAKGDRPIAWTDYGALSNSFASIPPLWPSGGVGSNVTGYVGLAGGLPVRKICGMWETHAPRVSHLELAGRISINDLDPEFTFDADKFHSTFVAGIIGASGLNPEYRGAANGCKISTYSSKGNFEEIAALTNTTVKDMRVSNHSYGKVNGWLDPYKAGGYGWQNWGGDLAFASPATGWEDYRFGLYTEESATADDTARNKPYHLLVKAAGNERNNVRTGRVMNVVKNGTNLGYSWAYSLYNYDQVLVNVFTGQFIFREGLKPDYDAGVVTIDDSTTIYTLPGPFTLPPDGNSDANYPGYDSLSEGFSVAKNTLCVGAMLGPFSTSDFSGAGPTDDGRLKPDVMALGENITLPLTGLGSFNDQATATAVGTSFAAPAISGAVTLLSQYQENLRTGKEPLRSSTFRALICHTARDISLLGPDYETGWGLVDAQAAAELIKTNTQRKNITEVFLANGQEATLPLYAVGGQPVKVTIAWNDPPGAAQPEPVVDPPGNSAPYKVLVNDLNLTLKCTYPTPIFVHLPFKPDPSNPHQAAVKDVNNRDNIEQVCISSPVTNGHYELKIQQHAGTVISGGGQWVSIIMEGVTPQGPPETLILYAEYIRPTPQSVAARLYFGSVLGGYYKIQCQQFSDPTGTWVDMSPILYSLGNMVAAPTSEATTVPDPSYNVTWRVVAVPPNPFNLTP